MRKLTREVRIKAIQEKIIDMYECAYEAEEYEGYTRAELEEEYYSRIRKLEILLKQLKETSVYDDIWLGVWKNSCIFSSTLEDDTIN